jgi:hypothetical protein
MKIRELVESRQQLNEFAPLAIAPFAALAPYLPTALAWVATASVGAILTVAGAYLTGEFIKDIAQREGLDPRRWSKQTRDSVLEEAVQQILFTVLGAAAYSRIGKKIIVAMIAAWPDRLKDSTISAVLEEVRKKLTTPNPADAAQTAPIRDTRSAAYATAEKGIGQPGKPDSGLQQ